jgi:GrpB-like predicted nucleotidyltransferase (UPF0157 family)
MKILDKNVNRKYHFSEYNPDWVNQFNSHKKFLSEIFGSKALFIEHVGSTSVPGMKAKPVIDVLIVVDKMEDFVVEKEKMVALGYEWGQNYIAQNTLIFFKPGPDGEKLDNIHVCEKGAPKVKQFIVKRDYLRAFPEKANDLKEANHKQHPDDYVAYRAAKERHLLEMEKEAYTWAATILNV